MTAFLLHYCNINFVGGQRFLQTLHGNNIHELLICYKTVFLMQQLVRIKCIHLNQQLAIWYAVSKIHCFSWDLNAQPLTFSLEFLWNVLIILSKALHSFVHPLLFRKGGSEHFLIKSVWHTCILKQSP